MQPVVRKYWFSTTTYARKGRLAPATNGHAARQGPPENTIAAAEPLQVLHMQLNIVQSREEPGS